MFGDFPGRIFHLDPFGNCKQTFRLAVLFGDLVLADPACFLTKYDEITSYRFVPWPGVMSTKSKSTDQQFHML